MNPKILATQYPKIREMLISKNKNAINPKSIPIFAKRAFAIEEFTAKRIITTTSITTVTHREV